MMYVIAIILALKETRIVTRKVNVTEIGEADRQTDKQTDGQTMRAKSNFNDQAWIGNVNRGWEMFLLCRSGPVCAGHLSSSPVAASLARDLRPCCTQRSNSVLDKRPLREELGQGLSNSSFKNTKKT